MFNFVNNFFLSFILVGSVALSACGPVGNLMNQSESNVGEAGLMPSKKPSAEAGSFDRQKRSALSCTQRLRISTGQVEIFGGGE